MSSAAATHPAAPASTAGPARRSAGDMVFMMGTKLLYALTRVALPPLTLAHVGMADYGLWATCFVLVSYLGMTASGFTVVYLRGVADARARGDVGAASRLLSTGMICMATIAALLLALVWLTLPSLLSMFHIAPDKQGLAATLWLGACGVFLADMVLGGFANALHALQRIRQEQQVWVVAFLLEMVLIVAFLNAGWGLIGLLAAFALRYAFSATTNAVIVLRAMPGLAISPRHFDRSLLKMFFGLGTGVQVGGLIATLLHSADRLLAGILVGPQATAVFDLATKLPVTGASIPSSVSYVALSAAARAHAVGDHEALARVHLDATRLTVLPLAAILPPLVVFAPALTGAWLGARGAEVALPMSLLAFGMHWHLLTGPTSAVFRGSAKLIPEYAYYALRLSALAIAATIWKLSPAGGLPSLALGLCVSQTLAALVYLAGSARALDLPLAGLVRSTAWPTLAAYGAALAIAALWPLPVIASRADSFAHLAGLGAAWSLLAAIGAWHWMLGHEQRIRVIEKCRRLPLVRTWSRA